MHETYEAIYENGELSWLNKQPQAGRHHVLVTILDLTKTHSQHDVHNMLTNTSGAWGEGKSLDEIDAELDRIRAEWDREQHL